MEHISPISSDGFDGWFSCLGWGCPISKSDCEALKGDEHEPVRITGRLHLNIDTRKTNLLVFWEDQRKMSGDFSIRFTKCKTVGTCFAQNPAWKHESI